MKNVKGWWLPDQEAHIDEYFTQTGGAVTTSKKTLQGILRG